MKKLVIILCVFLLISCEEECETSPEMSFQLETNYYLFSCIKASDDGINWQQVGKEYLPFSQASDQMYYVFHEKNKKDTLIIQYERLLEYSDNCGMDLQYQNVQIIKNTFPKEINVEVILNNNESKYSHIIKLNHFLF